MEGDLSIEKGIGFYLLVLNGIESMVTWGIGAFVVKEFGIGSLGFVGMLSSAFAFGKLAGYRAVSYYSVKVQVKWVLMSLFFGSACSSLAFGFANSFVLVLICRFASGVFANSQFAIRKLLHSIDLKLKDPSSNPEKKALLAYRTGGALAILITAFLTNCEDFMPPSSQFVQKKFLLISLLIFLLNLSGMLLVFSIESKTFVIADPSQYIELPESKENKDSEDNPDKQTKEKSDFVNYLQSSVLANEHIVSEESVGPEEVKFYSPREHSNKDLNTRNINSARPKPENSFNFPDAVTETKEHDRPEGEGKRTHISFIEEELENIEVPKTESLPEVKVQEKEKKVENLTEFAFRVRVLLTVGISLVNEAVPVSVFLALGQHVYKVGAVVVLVFFLGVGGYYVLCERIMQKFSVGVQMGWITGVLFGTLVIFPVFVAFVNEWVLIGFWVCWVFATEAILGFGDVLLADSVSNLQRESVLDRCNLVCIWSKVVCASLAGFGVAFGEFQVGFAVFSMVFGVFYWAVGKAKKLFPNISEVPYRV